MRRPLAAAATLLIGCGHSSGVSVSHAFAFAPASGSEMSAYFTVVNHGRAVDSLLTVSSPLAASATVHRQAEMEGMVHMEPAGALAIAPGDSLVLSPGGLHLMLELSGRAPAAGDTLPITLRLAHAGEITLHVPVRAYGDMP